MPVRLEHYLEPHYEPHYTAWKDNPSPATTGNLLRQLQPVIHEALRSYGGMSATSPTLNGKAKQLALRALQSYAPDRAKLRTHLLSQLQGLRRLAAREEQIIRIPEQLSLDRTRLHTSQAQLQDKLGREPSDAELADQAGLSLRRITHIRRMQPSFAEGAMTRTSEDGASLWQPATVSPRSERLLKTWHEVVYHDLAPMDQLILEHKLGLHGKPVLANQAIAQKLRISPGAVSQRSNKIQEKLDALHATGLIQE